MTTRLAVEPAIVSQGLLELTEVTKNSDMEMLLYT